MDKEGNDMCQAASGLTWLSLPLAQNPGVQVSFSWLLIPRSPNFFLSYNPAASKSSLLVFGFIPRSPLALPSVFLVPLLNITNLFAVCGHEVEAAGGDGESDWHSSKFQVTPPQDRAEWAATGLGKGPESQRLPHTRKTNSCLNLLPTSPSPIDPTYLSPPCCPLSTRHSLTHQTDGLPGERGGTQTHSIPPIQLGLPQSWGRGKPGQTPRALQALCRGGLN